MPLSKAAKRNRRKSLREIQEASGGRSRYPDFVITTEDRNEYDVFLSGLPVVNMIFFQGNFKSVMAWLSEGCPVASWSEIKKCLWNISSYLSGASDFAPLKDTVLKRLSDESDKEAPDAEVIRATWNEIIAFSAT